MRPVRLELEGFTAFRDPTVVDFEGVDLFALCGATGSGKTTVLDGIVFALYGNVPRLQDQRAVAPVIAQGMAEARVRLDFLLGTERYTAVRVVRSTKGGGATTAEARLERAADNVVLAGTADEVTAAVIELLGLSYDHFTKCVLLPQGEFARFLHDKPKDRQDLLVSLLGLGVYGVMANLAGQRAAAAGNEVAVLDGRLGDLAAATPHAIAAAEARVGALEALLRDLDAAAPALAELDREAAAHRAAADAATRATALLAGVRTPAGVADLDAAVAAAIAARESASTALAAADAAVDAAEATAAALPSVAELTALRDRHGRVEGLQARVGKGAEVVAARRAEVEQAQAQAEVARAALATARAAAEAAAAAHRAHAVRADLVVGAPCPVCEQVVTTLPAGSAPPALEEARAAAETADHGCRAAEQAAGKAQADLGAAEALLDGLTGELQALAADLAVGPDQATAAAQLAAAVAAASALDERRREQTSARRALDTATAAERVANAASADARHDFDTTRDTVAALGPPPRLGGGASLADEWAALGAWAGATAAQLQTTATEAIAAQEAVESARAARLAELSDLCAAAEVTVGVGADPIHAAREAMGSATAEVARLAAMVADRERLEAQRAGVIERRDVARELAKHLNAAHFEKWVLGEAMRGLADSATALLHTLSGGQYSLRVDGKGSFVVVDHRNADAVRSARTLSGGETFLASLALSLALAERTSAVGGATQGRLESIFLDEGFGTLDADTLDTVAGAIEELGASGRMVGVVSHVADLAERLPVRFEVHRITNASTVERVER